jgi:hypothetical protein
VLIQVVFMAGVLLGRGGAVEEEERAGGAVVKGAVVVTIWVVEGVVGTVGGVVDVVE